MLPHLFLTSALRERKPGEVSGNVLGLTTPWADIQAGAPQPKSAFCFSLVPTQGLQRGGECHGTFSNPKLPIKISESLPPTHNRVFSPELLNRNLKSESECLSRIPNIYRGTRNKGNCHPATFSGELQGKEGESVPGIPPWPHLGPEQRASFFAVKHGSSCYAAGLPLPARL